MRYISVLFVLLLASICWSTSMPAADNAQQAPPATPPAMTSTATTAPVVVYSTEQVVVTDYGPYYEVLIRGGKETLQTVFNERVLNTSFRDEIDRYIAARKKWLSAENEKALRDFFAWALPNGFVHPPLTLDSDFYFQMEQGIERLLAQQLYVNREEVRFRIPKQGLPALGPLGNVPVASKIEIGVIKAERPGQFRECGEIKIPCLPECEPTQGSATTVVSAGGGPVGTYVAGRGPVTTQRESLGVVIATRSTSSRVEKPRPPRPPRPCPPGTSPGDPNVPTDPGYWPPNTPTQPGDIGPHDWEPNPPARR